MSTTTAGVATTAAAVNGPPELMLATPDWLYCLVGRWAITAGWPSLKPRALCAVLHLVESRAQVTRTPNPTHICSRLVARWAVLSVLSSVKFTAQYR